MDILSTRLNVFSSSIQAILCELNLDDWKVFEYESVKSTIDTAKRLLYDHTNVIVLSKVQTEGRGTKNRTWSSPSGGIWLTVGSQDRYEIAEYSSIVAKGISVLLSYLVGKECIHKPVNDIILANKKVAGVLVETKILRNHLSSLVVGVGINVFNKIPDYLANGAISLSEFFVPYTLEELAVEIALEIIFLLRKYRINH